MNKFQLKKLLESYPQYFRKKGSHGWWYFYMHGHPFIIRIILTSSVREITYWADQECNVDFADFFELMPPDIKKIIIFNLDLFSD